MRGQIYRLDFLDGYYLSGFLVLILLYYALMYPYLTVATAVWCVDQRLNLNICIQFRRK